MIGKALLHYRNSRGYTQSFVAQGLKVALRTYWSWEHNEHEPSVSDLRRITDFFGLATVDELYRDVTEAQ